MADNIQVEKKPLSILTREPVATMFVLQAGLAMGIGYGLDLSTEQMGLTLTFASAVLALITRQQVTPFVSTGTTPRAESSANTPLVK